MGKEEKDRPRDSGSGKAKGAIYVVGTGPGAIEQMTGRACEVLASAHVVVGYTRYVDLLGLLVEGKKIFTSSMTEEVERCTRAIELASEGETVAVVSSGDSGVYGMAGLVLELAAKLGADVDIEVVPGMPAFVAAAALLGAPLMHDFASISLSDLLTPWETITKRVAAAASADFVIVLYNPKSRKRKTGLGRAVDIIRQERDPETPVGIVRNAAREHQEVRITTLKEFDQYYEDVDMLTIIIIGNSTTRFLNKRMVTPRGYKGV